MRNFSDQSVLLHAVYGGNTNIVTLSLDIHAPYLNAKDKSGQSPLVVAADKGNLELSKLLLERGAFVNVANAKGETALMMAAAKGHVKVVQLLLARKASVL